MYKAVLCIILIAYEVQISKAIEPPHCCDGQNIILEHKCQGKNLSFPECKGKLIMLEDDHKIFSVDDKQNLVEEGEILETSLGYCYSKDKDGIDIYVLCFDEGEFESEERVQTTIKVILLMISVFFILLTIAVYLIVPKILDLQGISVIHSISGLACSFTCLIILEYLPYQEPHVCSLIAYLIYFCFMYAFFWLNVISFHIWRTSVNPKILKSIKQWPLIYHIVGIGGPLIFLAFTLTAHYSNLYFLKSIHPGIGESKCWFQSLRETFIYFYGPMTLLITINMIYFISTTIVLWKQINGAGTGRTRALKYRLILTVKLFFIMGITWIFEAISAVWLTEHSVLRWLLMITDFINALQGFLIFLILVVFRKRVLRGLANRTIFNIFRLPANWRHLQDEECEEEEQDEVSLSNMYKKYNPQL